MSEAVQVEQHGEVLTITLNRPEALNAINGELARGLGDAVARLDGDQELCAGVLAGSGRGFCSGMDLKAFAKREDISPAARFLRNRSQKPMIAAVEGFALAGGLELALACDLIVAGGGAKFGIPEVKVGLFAAGGGVVRLPARVGLGKALEMAITGDPISAEEAAALGLVTRLAEPGRALETAMELASRIAGNAPLAVAASRRMVHATQTESEAALWEVQEPLRKLVFGSNDAKEGPRAFAEKRGPAWTAT